MENILRRIFMFDFDLSISYMIIMPLHCIALIDIISFIITAVENVCFIHFFYYPLHVAILLILNFLYSTPSPNLISCFVLFLLYYYYDKCTFMCCFYVIKFLLLLINMFIVIIPC